MAKKKVNLPFFKREKDTLYFTGHRLEIFLPKEYFDNKMAEFYGNKISTIGMFVYRVFLTKKDYEADKARNFQMILPDNIFFEFSENERIKMSLSTDDKDQNYEVFVLNTGDMFIENLQLTQFFQNTEDFVNLHHNGRIPNIIDYKDLLKLYIDSMRNNNASLRMPLLLIEMIISELARDKKNLDVPFRKKIGKGNVGEKDYLQLSIKNLAMRNSTFTAITSEDMNMALISSINKTEHDGVEKETPIEKTIKY